MQPTRAGQIAVIFAAHRTTDDEAGYGAAASHMSALAASQTGYCGMIHTRDGDGFGITISYWQDEASAAAWRDHPDHTRIRELGRERWYSDYTLDVARIERNYGWSRDG